jgi:predicted phage terminase large subunit-like protein
MWPTWAWAIRPQLKFVFASYSASLSLTHSGLRSTVLHSDWWKENWGDKCWLMPGHDNKAEMGNNMLGEMFTSSVGGSTTGRGGDIIVIDDPLDPKQALSDTMRGTANTWIKQTMSSRLNNKKKGAVVLVMQRLHEDDVTGTVLREGGWVHLKIPGIATEHQKIIFPVSGRVVIREPGDVLWPERENKAMLDHLRTNVMGSYAFSGQYQQEPAPDEGGILKKQWWQYYKLTDDFLRLTPHQRELQLPKMNQVMISWDMSFKDLATSDYCAGTVWGRAKGQYYLIDVVYDHLDFPAAKEAVKALYRRHPHAMAILIEEAANGVGIIQSLRKSVHRIIPVRPHDSKIARVHAISPLVEAGNVFLPHPDCAPWIEEFILQCARFPNATHDDFVDSMTQALSRLSRAMPEK